MSGITKLNLREEKFELDNPPQFVYVVGERTCDKESVLHVCASYTTALKKWDEIRLNAIEVLYDSYQLTGDKLALKQIHRLEMQDPRKLNNFPYIEPFIYKTRLMA